MTSFNQHHHKPRPEDKICPRCAITDGHASYDWGGNVPMFGYYKLTFISENISSSPAMIMEYWKCENCKAVYMFKKEDK